MRVAVRLRCRFRVAGSVTVISSFCIAAGGFGFRWAVLRRTVLRLAVLVGSVNRLAILISGFVAVGASVVPGGLIVSRMRIGLSSRMVVVITVLALSCVRLSNRLFAVIRMPGAVGFASRTLSCAMLAMRCCSRMRVVTGRLTMFGMRVVAAVTTFEVGHLAGRT